MPFGTRYTDTLNLPYLKFHALTLFGPGGGGGGGQILPAATLDVNNFFNIKANAMKLGDFFQNLSGNNLI